MTVKRLIICLFTATMLLMASNALAEDKATVTEPVAVEDEASDIAANKDTQTDGEPDEEGEDEDATDDFYRSTKPIYTAEISDEELAKRWKEDPESVGSISFGITSAGRLMNGVQFPDGEGWVTVDKVNNWGTIETIEYMKTAITAVNRLFPDTPPLSLGDLSTSNGGHFRPHKSHQAGRDIDVGFYYEDGQRLHFNAGDASNMDLPRNWALVRALIVSTDVQMILVDKRIQKLLYNYALSIGEDPRWLDTIFKAGRASIVKHVRRHRGHYHVRFFSPKAQEMGRRIIPVIKSTENEVDEIVRETEPVISYHHVKNGDCLGSISRKYGVSITALKKANKMSSNAIRAGRTLIIPAAGGDKYASLPVKKYPIPTEFILPERRLPPSTPELFANVEGLDHRLASARSVDTGNDGQPSYYIGSGGLFPPFRTLTIPMGY